MNYLNYSDYSNQNNLNLDYEKKTPVRHNKTIKKSTTALASPDISDLYNKIHQQGQSSEDGLSSFKPLDKEETNNGIVTEAPSVVPVNNMAAKIQEYTDNYYKNPDPDNNPDNHTYKGDRSGPGSRHGQVYNNADNNLMSQDVLLTKLTYIIKLLEEQQDERTSFVVEELILYSFLGIFIIFIIDSFGKASKYIR